jgi:hypothetical protein
MSPGTFTAFSKFHLNTSKPPNVKVVYFVEGHNFHVEWHSWFEVQNGEKCRSTPRVTIHWRPENSKLGIAFVHKWLRKRPDAISRSCRGSRDPQLSYKSFGPLLLKKFEKNPPKQCYPEMFGARMSRNAGVRDVVPGHIGLTAVHHCTCTPRLADD